MKYKRFKEHQIKRTCKEKFDNYKKYKPYLRKDFQERCCYCNMSSELLTIPYHIEHFIPVNAFKENYDKRDNISDTTKYEDHFVAENRLIAISKSGRSMDSEDVQNFLNATERGIDVQLFVRKNKDDKISKEFYYLGRVIATGNAKQFVMPNTDKTAVEIEWELETPVREDIYQYIVNE